MKTNTKLLALILFIIGINQIFAQTTKAEVYLTGTKITYYINQCGNTVAGTQGKLTYCDENNNLAVVEKSTGLNYRGVTSMLPNFYNQDEYYTTNNGLSIRKEDGTWDNIPKFAMPNYSTTYSTTLQNGIVMPNGNILIFYSNSNYSMAEYNPSTKTLTTHNFADYYYPLIATYDSDTQNTWILARSSSYIKLLSFNATNGLTDYGIISGMPANATGTNKKMLYNNQKLYFGYDGIYALDISDTSNITFTKYDSTSTPALPIDLVTDFTFDSNNNLWLTQIASYNGYISKLNFTNNTIQSYQGFRPDNNSILSFKSIAVDGNDNFFAVATNYSGFVNFSLDANGDPVFNYIEKTTIDSYGFPYTYVPHAVYYTNSQFYFVTIDGSSSDNSNYEIIIYNGNTWDGRNDDETGNLSQRENSRFSFNHPDKQGGMWWFNRYDDLILYRDANGNNQSILLQGLGYTAAVDMDNKAVIKGGNPNELRKIDFPNTTSIQAGTTSDGEIVFYDNKIWVYSYTYGKIDVYQNDILINTYTLDQTDYNYYYRMAIADDGNPYFFRKTGNTLSIRYFDLNTQTSTTTDYTLATGINPTRILAAPNNALWLYGTNGIIYYQNNTLYEFSQTDYPSYIYYITDAVVDSNNKFIYTIYGSIITLENPMDANPVFTNQLISSQYNNPLLPDFNGNLSTISIDSNGNVWSFIFSGGAVRLTDNDFATEYQKEILSVTDDLMDNSNLQVYPNPTNNILHINFKSSSNYTFIVYNILGKKILQQNTNQLNNSISVKNITSGVYILKVINNNTSDSQSIRFIKK